MQGTATLLLAVAGVLGLAIGFPFQDLTDNLISGIMMGIRKRF
nr:mechanosensitive ion channel domain-containing protein [Vibrio coralliilyticus]